MNHEYYDIDLIIKHISHISQLKASTTTAVNVAYLIISQYYDTQQIYIYIIIYIYKHID